jgi:1-aminocyclopropane-1-carboxylate deaminase/D-cysteine desulfhydrase-like pyridoxal-dependent ACC family enzyme
VPPPSVPANSAGSAVLVTGGRAPVAVILARVLAAAGFRVFTADSLTPALTAYSQAVESHLSLPSPRFAPEACAQAIVRAAREFGIRRLLPTCEEVYHLAAQRSLLESVLEPLFPDLAVLDRLHNKHTCMQLAADLGLRAPTTTLVRDPADLDAPHISGEGILKRCYSRFSSHVVRLPPDPAKRQAAAREALDGAAWVHQDYVPGRDVCSYTLCRAGRPWYHVAYATPYRVGAGAGVYYESIPGTESLAFAAALAGATNFTGQLSLDFRAPHSGEGPAGLTLLECNPRATMGAALAAADAAFPAVLADWIEGKREPPSPILAPACLRRQMKAAMLLYGCRGRAADRTLGDWLRDWLGTPDALADRADPRPARAQYAVLATYSRRARAAGMTLTGFTTHDLEWNGPDTDPAGRSPVSAVPTPDPPLGPAVDCPLLRAVPALAQHLPRVPLVREPTPVEAYPAPGCERLLVKRDDRACPSYGGNKARKLEFVLGEALARGAREVWTAGGLCSNHCTATAVYARQVGLEVTLFYSPTPLDAEERDLLLVQAHLGARLRLLPALSEWPRLGRRPAPFLIPPGGSSPAGLYGYANAALELAEQVRSGEVPAPDVIYMAAASRGSVAGLAAGLSWAGLRPKVVAVETVHAGWRGARRLLPAARRARGLLGPDAPPPLPITGDRRYAGIPLGVRDARVTAALAWAGERGFPADPHFSGKALAALLADLAAGSLAGQTVLFWQTHGCLPPPLVHEARETGAALPSEIARAVARWLR